MPLEFDGVRQLRRSSSVDGGCRLIESPAGAPHGAFGHILAAGVAGAVVGNYGPHMRRRPFRPGVGSLHCGRGDGASECVQSLAPLVSFLSRGPLGAVGNHRIYSACPHVDVRSFRLPMGVAPLVWIYCPRPIGRVTRRPAQTNISAGACHCALETFLGSPTPHFRGPEPWRRPNRPCPSTRVLVLLSWDCLPVVWIIMAGAQSEPCR